MERKVPDDSLEGKFALLEEAREIVGLSVEEFEEFFQGFCKANRGHVWFERAIADVDVYLIGIGRKNYHNPKLGDIELVIRTNDTEEETTRAWFNLNDLASYFGSLH